MAITTRILTSTEKVTFDQAWAEIQSWADPAWKCSESEDTLPNQAWARSIVDSPDNRIVIAREQPQGVLGFAVYRIADARIVWIHCRPARFGEVVEALARAIQADTGQTTWGVIERSTPLAGVLRQGFTEPDQRKPGAIRLRP